MENKTVYVLRKLHGGYSTNILASTSIDKIISALDEKYPPEENGAGFGTAKIGDRRFAVTSNFGTVITFYQIEGLDLI